MNLLCKSCQTVLPEEAFFRDTQALSGRKTGACRECYKEKHNVKHVGRDPRAGVVYGLNPMLVALCKGQRI